MRACGLAIVFMSTGCGRINFDAPDGGNVDAVAASPPAFVQMAEGNADSLSTTTVTFAGNVTSGNLIVVAIDALTDLVSVTDSRGDIYVTTEPLAPSWRTYLGYAVVATTGPATVTATLSAPSAGYNLRACEYTNTAPINPVTMVGGANGTTVGLDAARTNVVTIEPNQLVFAFATFIADGSGGTGFTVRSTFDGDIVEERIVVVPGSLDAVATPSTDWAISAMAIRGR